ncbi:MAG: hypothetical protein ACWIPJ_07790, partial [Polaribacter sp.]
MKKIILTAVFAASCLITSAQVGVGTTTPEGALDVKSATAGFVMPRVANTGVVKTPQGGPVVNGTMVYDISSKCAKVYQNGVWSDCFSTGGTSTTGNIETINCVGTTVGTLYNGLEANGAFSIISYTGGDGSAHTGQTVGSTGVTGLTATLSTGSFTKGAGTLLYAITGKASRAGIASFAISIGGQMCTLKRTVVAAPVGDATFTLPQSATVVSTLEGNPAVDIQGVVDNNANQLTVNLAYTGGSGSYAGYTSAAVLFTTGTQEGTDTNGFSISYPSGTFSASGSIAVTIKVDGDGTFNAKRQLFGVLAIIASMDFQVNGVSKGNVKLQVVGGIPDRAFGDGVHDFVYVPVIGKDGKTWLNHNLGADYSNVHKNSFSPITKAKRSNDFHAYGSLYQWGR